MKEAHAVVKPEVKEEDTTLETPNDKSSNNDRSPPKKHIYPCRPCNKKFEDLKALERQIQFL